MLCPKCNQSVADDARFCGHCGQPLSAAGNPDASTRPPPRGPVSDAGAGTAAWDSGSTASTRTLIDRVKNILITPKTEWPIIAAEPTSVAQLFKGYVIPLAAFAAVMNFIRMSLIGFGFWRLPVITGLIYALTRFGFALLGVYLVGLIIDALAPTFAGERNQRQAMKCAAYMFTPAAVGTVFALLPGLGGVLQLLAALYGIYILYLGLPVLMRSSQDKAVGYTATAVVCSIFVVLLLGVLISVFGRVTGYSLYPSPYGFQSGLTRAERQQQAAAAIGSLIAGAAQTPAAAPGAQTPTAGAQGAAATAAVVAALGGAMSGNRRVEPVDFQTLKTLLPDALPGMQRTDSAGNSQGAMGMKASSATGEYSGAGGTHVQIKIVDASAVSGLLGLADAMAANASSESDTGFEKNATVAGRPVHEKYDSRSKHGEVIAIVARRFTVDVSGDGIDMPAIEQCAALVDYSKLDAMRDAGLQSQ